MEMMLLKAMAEPAATKESRTVTPQVVMSEFVGSLDSRFIWSQVSQGLP